MLKKLSAIPLLLAMAAGPAHAEFLYQGYLKVTAKNSKCTKGPSVGTLMRTMYHPRIVTGATQNANMSALTVTNSFDAQSYRLKSQDFISTPRTVTNVIQKATGLKTLQPSKIAVTSRTPATLTTATTAVTLVGKITNPKGLGNQTGCIIDFRWTGFLRF